MYCPLQSVVHEQQLAHLMPRLLSIVLPGQCADRGGLASMCLQVLHAAISGCSADPARLWPLQLLAWLLQAQRDKCAATEQVGNSFLSLIWAWPARSCLKSLQGSSNVGLCDLSKQQSGIEGSFTEQRAAAG